MNRKCQHVAVAIPKTLILPSGVYCMSVYNFCLFWSSFSDGVLLKCSQLDRGHFGTRQHVQTSSASTYIKRYFQVQTHVGMSHSSKFVWLLYVTVFCLLFFFTDAFPSSSNCAWFSLGDAFTCSRSVKDKNELPLLWLLPCQTPTCLTVWQPCSSNSFNCSQLKKSERIGAITTCYSIE